jgi:hypothetical protein
VAAVPGTYSHPTNNNNNNKIKHKDDFTLPFNLSVRDVILGCTIIVFSRDSPATRRRGSIGSGGESSSILTSVEGNAVQAFCTRKNANE